MEISHCSVLAGPAVGWSEELQNPLLFGQIENRKQRDGKEDSPMQAVREPLMWPVATLLSSWSQQPAPVIVKLRPEVTACKPMHPTGEEQPLGRC